jgi:LPS-assembly lipoprotein
MSFIKGPAGRHVAAIAVAAAVAAAPAGCGFQPIHSDRSYAAAANLSLVEIELVPDRLGQMLRNELLDQFRPRAAGTQFLLSVTVSESIQNLGMQLNSVATRANLRVRAAYSVSRISDNEAMIQGSLESINSYNILRSDFATLAAQADARRHAVREIAKRLQERVSVWLVQTGGQPAVRRTETAK